MMSKAWKDSRSVVTSRKKVMGARPGSVTARKRAQALAPSTRAASYSSFGMPCSPARKITAA